MRGSAPLFRSDAEQSVTRPTDALCPAQGGGGLTLVSPVARIAGIDGKVREEQQPAPQPPQSWTERQKQTQEMIEIVCFGNGLAKFLEQCLQVFFGRLLAQETELIMKRLASAGDGFGEPIIAFALSHPFSCGSFHKGLSPSSRSRCETTRLP